MRSKIYPTTAWLTLLLALYSHAQPTDQQLLQAFQWRNIGPANQGGRVVDIEALDADFTHVLMATGSGGVWKSDNAGTTWTPIFDHYSTASIGDIAVNQQDPNMIWVGTGEANNRNSVSWGDGVFKSTDGGATFTNVGLNSTHQIARVVLHPEDPDLAYVAAIGHLWGYSGDRGLFLTKDGGETWEKLTNGLPDDGKTGCIDLIMDPNDPKTLYAAFYQRLRQPWHFHSGGPNGGIFKSTNGGRTWKKLTRGLPEGETGRIGLAIYRKDPRILMAIVEAKQSDNLETPGSGIYRSEDAGQSWQYVNTYNNRPFYYSQIRINPHDDQRVYVLTTRFMVSTDGGKTLTNGSEDQEVHGDFHALWSDPTHADRYYLGADKGLSITHDHGESFRLIDNLSIAQFYRINVDMRDPYYVYGGLQDNGMYGMASFARDARGILSDHNWKLHWGDGQFINADPGDWRKVLTSMENGSVFTYDAATYDMHRISPTQATVTNYDEEVPDSLQGTSRAFRFNWTAPMLRSPHDPDVIYLAGNHVFKSVDMGAHWEIISPDLSTNDAIKRRKGVSGGLTLDNSGAETHCAVYTMSLSPIDPRLIWVGTDDGQVQITRDGGQHWTNVRAHISGVPDGIWVSRIEASHHDPSVAYITFDGHRSDQNQPWVFKTDDYGHSWLDISANIPANEVLRVVREDRVNSNLLFVGSETGIFASLNGGASWHRFMAGMPTVSVYDLVTHPRDQDLVAGSHGRGIWIADDIAPLQQLDPVVLSSEAWLFEPPTATIWANTSRGGQRGHFLFAGSNPPTIENTSSVPRAEFRSKAVINYMIAHPFDDAPELEISTVDGRHRLVAMLENTPGLHRFYWDLEFDSEWFTSEQKAKVEELFAQLLEQYSFSSLRRASAAFQAADTPRKQRAAVQILRSGYLSFDLDDSYGIPQAGPGAYVVTLRAGGQEYLRRLIVRADPLADD